MGQGASQPQQRDEGSRLGRHQSVLRRSNHRTAATEGEHGDGLLAGQSSGDRRRNQPRATRPSSISRLSQLLHMDSSTDGPARDNRDQELRTGSMLSRTRSTFRDMLSRRDTARARPQNSSRNSHSGILQHRASYVRADGHNRDAEFPARRLPSFDLNSAFDTEPLAASSDLDLRLNSTSNASYHHHLRLNSLRPDRPFRRLASLRRRRSPPPTMRRAGGVEDQAAMLSRLLSVAAAATAATLMGNDPNALAEARSLTGGTGSGDIGGGGEDGSFDGFLRALQNGRIASALRAGADSDANSSDSAHHPPLNFFRMFRFGSHNSTEPNQFREGATPDSESEDPDHRMVPIIIVGIRSISPNSNYGGSESDLPPFIDALGNFPSPIPTHAFGQGHESIDSILRPPQNGTSFRHRRRASIGAFGMSRNRLNDRMDDQRDHRSPERRRERPWSVASSNSTFEPRPPPATPASPSPELSRISSRQSTPNHSRPPSFIANSVRDPPTDSRRNSTFHRASAASPLSSHTEETLSVHSTHSSTNLLSARDAENIGFNAHRRSQTSPNIHFPRFASGHPRRNGVVEPDHLPPLSRTSTSSGTEASGNERASSSNDNRSWIIYVLGGSYPENHPIVTTPSLFTENPTYEDMMLLSALLGPAKAPVASEEDVASAGGIYMIQLGADVIGTARLEAIAVDDSAEGNVRLEIGQTCQVCLCEFEIKELARKLVKCNHLFHKECIDQWLTQGRNSCPLCRGQGVDEKEQPADLSETSSVSRAPPFPEPVMDFSEEPSFASSI